MFSIRKVFSNKSNNKIKECPSSFSHQYLRKAPLLLRYAEGGFEKFAMGDNFSKTAKAAPAQVRSHAGCGGEGSKMKRAYSKKKILFNKIQNLDTTI